MRGDPTYGVEYECPNGCGAPAVFVHVHDRTAADVYHSCPKARDPRNRMTRFRALRVIEEEMADA